jgi:hypothetical protein
MNTTEKYVSNTSSKIDSLYQSFNKFIIENYTPTEAEQQKYEQ